MLVQQKLKGFANLLTTVRLNTTELANLLKIVEKAEDNEAALVEVENWLRPIDPAEIPVYEDKEVMANIYENEQVFNDLRVRYHKQIYAPTNSVNYSKEDLTKDIRRVLNANLMLTIKNQR